MLRLNHLPSPSRSNPNAAALMATGIGSPSSRLDPDHLPLAGRYRRPVRATPPPRAEPSPPAPDRCEAIADAGAAGGAAQQQQSWPGLPRGVEFNPSDSDILWHLAAEVGNGLAHRHPFITEFIIPVDDDRGFSCTHPQDIPGVRQDGRASYFFHKRFDLYNNESDKNISWQKVGSPKSIILDGTLRGCKEEFVLYAYNMRDNSPQKTDWGLHQYHIRNTLKDEGELVVLKIFHKSQNHQCESAEKSPAESEWDISTHDDSKEEQTQEEMYADHILCTTGFNPMIQINDYAETDYLDHISLQERYRILLADKSSCPATKSSGKSVIGAHTSGTIPKRNHEGTTYREDICCVLQEISSAPPIVESMDDDSSRRLLGEDLSDTQMSAMECFVGSNRYQRACSSRDSSELPITQLVNVKLEPALEGYEIDSSENPRAKSHHSSENDVLEGAGSIPGCLSKESEIERLHRQGDLVENTTEICKGASAEASSQAKNTHGEGSVPYLGVKSELTESDLPGLCDLPSSVPSLSNIMYDEMKHSPFFNLSVL